MADRSRIQELSRRFLSEGKYIHWFEEFYKECEQDPSRIPWADGVVNPNLSAWIDSQDFSARRILVVGCGLGDDAEYLAAKGFEVTAFDIAPTAIALCRRRFPGSRVRYETADLLNLPAPWHKSFDFVFEAYTLQALPPILRAKAIQWLGYLVAPGGRLLIVARGRDEGDPLHDIPWPVSRSELDAVVGQGLEPVSFEDYIEQQEAPVRRFRAVYRRRLP